MIIIMMRKIIKVYRMIPSIMGKKMMKIKKNKLKRLIIKISLTKIMIK
jgi:hypothetical protein